MEIAICADNSIKCVSDCRIDRVKALAKEDKPVVEDVKKEEIKSVAQCEEACNNTEETPINSVEQDISKDCSEDKYHKNDTEHKNRRNRRGRFDRRRNRYLKNNDFIQDNANSEPQEAVILYDSHSEQSDTTPSEGNDTKKGKSNWWKKLIKG